MTIHQYPFEYFKMSTLYFIVFPFLPFKEITLDYWSLQLSAGRHMYRNYTTLLRSVLSAECAGRRRVKSRDMQRVASTASQLQSSGFPEHRPGTVTMLPPQWSEPSDIIIIIIIIIVSKAGGMSFIASTSYISPVKWSHQLYASKVLHKSCIVGLIAKIWLFSTWFILCKSDISFTV